MTQAQILILDDERSGVQHLQDALSGYHAVHYSRSILEAKAELERRDYDLIICGVHLLHESMFEFLRDMKQRAQMRGIPFVCFRAVETKFGQQLDVQIEAAARILGAVEYIVVEKDRAEPAVLRQRIEEHLLRKTDAKKKSP